MQSDPLRTPGSAARAPRHGGIAPRRGALGEEIAAAFLQLSGLQVLGRNLRGEAGEVDIVARDGPALVFVEVRLRSAGAWSSAAGSIGHDKRRRLRACARSILRRRQDLCWPGRTVRFDVVTIDLQADALALSHLRAVRLDG
jgi:putative endonuclease